jgi:hypothetical protein
MAFYKKVKNSKISGCATSTRAKQWRGLYGYLAFNIASSFGVF